MDAVCEWGGYSPLPLPMLTALTVLARKHGKLLLLLVFWTLFKWYPHDSHSHGFILSECVCVCACAMVGYSGMHGILCEMVISSKPRSECTQTAQSSIGHPVPANLTIIVCPEMMFTTEIDTFPWIDNPHEIRTNDSRMRYKQSAKHLKFNNSHLALISLFLLSKPSRNPEWTHQLPAGTSLQLLFTLHHHTTNGHGEERECEWTSKREEGEASEKKKKKIEEWKSSLAVRGTF